MDDKEKLKEYLDKLRKMRHESIHKRMKPKRWNPDIDNPHKKKILR